MIEPEQEALAIRSEESAEKLQQAEEAMSDWQHRWMSSVPVHRMPAGRPNWRNPEFALLKTPSNS